MPPSFNNSLGVKDNDNMFRLTVSTVRGNNDYDKKDKKDQVTGNLFELPLGQCKSASKYQVSTERTNVRDNTKREPFKY